jgi:7-cyano-7-deazaguanine synthase
MVERELLLLSGGIDSIALAAWRRPQEAVTIDYGQACADAEVRAASQVCKEFEIEHHIIRADCSKLGSGDLAGTTPLEVAPAPEWWPFRNQLLITFAAMRAVARGIQRIAIGTVNTDSFHADGTRAFLQQIDDLCRLQEGKVSVSAPAIDMTSGQLVRTSGISPELLAWAHSCHVADFACGRCRGCQKHRVVMEELGLGAY